MIAEPLGGLLLEPGDRDAGRRGRSDELELRDPEPAVEWAVGDVDQLHTAVGHRDEALEQDAATEHQIVLAQPVPDRARLPGHDGKGDRQDDRHDDARYPCPGLVHDLREDEGRGYDDQEERTGGDELNPYVLARDLVPGAVIHDKS